MYINVSFTGNLTCNATVSGESALASADIVVFSLRLIANPETVDKGSGTEVVCDLIPNTSPQLDTSFTLFGNDVNGKFYNC